MTGCAGPAHVDTTRPSRVRTGSHRLDHESALKMSIAVCGAGGNPFQRERNPYRVQCPIMRTQTIISGGQTGVDRAALEAGLSLNLQIGGWCPAGRLAEDGTIPAQYPMFETKSPAYPPRTRKNIESSNATLVLYESALEGGTAATVELAGKLRDFVASRVDDEYGLGIPDITLNISLPDEITAAMTRGVARGVEEGGFLDNVGDLNRYTQAKSADAMVAAASNPGGGGTMGDLMGMGVGIVAPMAYEWPGAAYLMMGLVGISAVAAILGGGIYIYATVGSLLWGKRVEGGAASVATKPTPLMAPAAVAQGYGSQGFAAPGTFVLAMVFLVSFILYYFVNWKYLSTVWGLS